MITLKDDSGEDQTLDIGDYVGFKYDVEQSGPIVRINRARRSVTVTATDGGYVHTDDCHEDCENCSADVEMAINRLWI
jgi:hypothetical protein